MTCLARLARVLIAGVTATTILVGLIVMLSYWGRGEYVHPTAVLIVGSMGFAILFWLILRVSPSAADAAAACPVAPMDHSGDHSGDVNRTDTPQNRSTDDDPASNTPTPENGD
jgi:hypothetical protein